MDRIINEEMEDPNRTEKSEIKRDPHMEYIERLLLKKKRNEAQNEKLKEDLHEKEDKECTFKPKLYSNSKISKAQGANRIEEMYMKGMEKERNRKDKTNRK